MHSVKYIEIRETENQHFTTILKNNCYFYINIFAVMKIITKFAYTFKQLET